MTRPSPVFSQAGGAGAKVAQVSNLLYRGFLIRSPLASRTACRLEVGDIPTRREKSALRLAGTLAPPPKNLRMNEHFPDMALFCKLVWEQADKDVGASRSGELAFAAEISGTRQSAATALRIRWA